MLFLLRRGNEVTVSGCSYMQDLFLCVTALYHALGNILTHELPCSSAFSASVRALMYSGTYIALNDAKIAAAGTTAGLNF